MRSAVRAIIINNGNLLVMHRNKFGEQYYTLVGGGVDIGESKEQALVREVSEETGLKIQKYKLVFIEEPGDPYGTQHIYLCDYPGGDASLPDSSPEAEISKLGKNIYRIEWIPIEKLPEAPFLSAALKQYILHAVSDGFPDQPLTIDPTKYRGEINGS
ncbi:MAG TPA: NUDIX hydrolase [Candidatus Saccharimonadales bacterium]|nr:NUDIX hydrolase [Candidatus Saccharimonadales bacterium]